MSDLLTNRVLANKTFDPSDVEDLKLMMNYYHTFHDDVEGMLNIQNHLESISIYFAEKYADICLDKSEEFDLDYYRRTRDLRETGLKGESLAGELLEHKVHVRLKRQLAEAKSLKEIFSKFHWAVIRKDSRIEQKQISMNRGGA